VKRIVAVVIVVVVVLVATLAWLDRHPLMLPPRGPRAAAVFPARDQGHAILLAIADPRSYARSEPERLDQRRVDLEWVNVLDQVFGGCDVRPLNTVLGNPEALLHDRKLLVLPRASLQDVAPDILTQLQPFVAQGLVVLLEGPEGPIASRLGIQAVRLETRTHLAWPFQGAGPTMEGPLVLQPPPPLRLDHRVVQSRPARLGGELLRSVASPGGRPLVWAHTEGLGEWLLCALDVADLSLRLRQGVPSEDFRLPGPSRGPAEGPGPTARLAAFDDERGARRPWLDAWLMALLDVETLPAPMPRLWPAPVDFDGWLLASYEDRPDEAGLARLAEMSSISEGRITALLLPSGGPEDRAVPADLATAVPMGLQVRWPGAPAGGAPPHRLDRLGPFRPWGRVLSPAGQRDLLSALLPADPSIAASRGEHGVWPEDVDSGWEQLAGAGFAVDASFGPAQDAGGWFFGSAMPYHPLDRRGLMANIWEVPVLVYATTDELDARSLSRWLRTNSSGAQGPVQVVLRPGTADDFTTRATSAWAALEGEGRRYHHKLATLTELVDFWEARAGCRLRWDLHGDRLRMEIQPYTPAKVGPLAVAVPREWHQRVVLSWSSSWSSKTMRRARSFGHDVMVFEIPPEGGALDLIYRTP
jgi:hypothetical protein